ncbi:SIP domain-containing protein [Leucobacter chromiireducens]|uniref:SIP domain-containing protein n=1 Tax=Leucobacter chromiireducens TaxID=283877 RepID=UPI003F7FC595
MRPALRDVVVTAREHPTEHMLRLRLSGDERGRQELTAPEHAEIVWPTRESGEVPGAQLAAATHMLDIHPGSAAWFAAEASAAREARRALRERELASPHAQGHWRAGVGDYRD